MEDLNTPSLAGEGESQPLAGGAVEMNEGPLTLEDAVERYSKAAEPETPEVKAEPVEETVAAVTPEPEAETQPETVEAEPSGIPWDKVPGDARFVLRDNTTITGAEIKQRFDDLRQVDRVRNELAQKVREFEQNTSQFAQREQQLSQILPLAIEAMQRSLPRPPQMPDPVADDPLGNFERMTQYQREVVDYQRRVGEFNSMKAAQAAQVERERSAMDARHNEFIQSERQKLYQAIPELKDPAKRQEFQARFFKHGTEHYGFSPEELGNAGDHRLLRMAADAIAYRELMASKPKTVAPTPAKPTAPTAPVAAPGQRVDPAAAAQEKRQELLRRARSRGELSLDEAVDLASQLRR